MKGGKADIITEIWFAIQQAIVASSERKKQKGAVENETL
jgi:hypothetical protein